MNLQTIRYVTSAVLIGTAIVLGNSGPAAQGPTYVVTDLGTLGGERSVAFGVNNRGQVVGYSETADGKQHAFLYSDGSMLDLGTFGGDDSYAYGINDLGMVVGRAADEEGIYRPFVALPGTPLVDLTSLDQGLRGSFGIATSINNLGQVVGYRQTPHPHNAARNRIFLFKDFAFTDLGPFVGEDGVATAINDAGEIAGYFGTEPHLDYADHRAVLFTKGVTLLLGTLGGRVTTPTDVNNAGHVVGHGQTQRGESHAFVYSQKVMTDLGTLPGGRQSAAYAVNDSGLVVGASETDSGPQSAFLYSQGVLQDLNSLIPEDSGWHLSEARDISNSGTIVGGGVRNGQVRAFRLSRR